MEKLPVSIENITKRQNKKAEPKPVLLFLKRI